MGSVGHCLSQVAISIPFPSLSVCTGSIGDFTLDPTPPAEFIFQPDENTQSISLTINDDNLLELNEDFQLSLFKDDTTIEGVIVNPQLGVTTITILDNECMAIIDTDQIIIITCGLY